MKRLTGFITRLFLNRKSRTSFFSEAIAEGFRETMREMGYGPSGNEDRNKQSKNEEGYKPGKRI